MEWQPIESAPKDENNQILTIGDAMQHDNYVVWAKNRNHTLWYQCSFWSEKHKTWVGWSEKRQPTHWMPLPKPPEAS